VITTVEYNESLIPAGLADFTWPPNNTQPTYTPSTLEPTSEPHIGFKLSGGDIAGIVIGAIGAVVIVLTVELWIVFRRKKVRASGPEGSGLSANN
jgi:hypothetical protein